MKPWFRSRWHCASPASAEVVSASSNGFEVRETVNRRRSPDGSLSLHSVEWRLVVGPEHSYSGRLGKSELDLETGGCFCERLPNGGGVEHMRVSYVAPGQADRVDRRAWATCCYQATTGVMDVKFDAAANGTQITVDYRAAGFANGGADKIAPAVDQVLSGQMNRLKAYLATTR